MSNSLEDFIRQNSEAFDDQEPHRSIWNKIETQLDHSHSISTKGNVIRWPYMVAAACSILLVGLVVGVYFGEHKIPSGDQYVDLKMSQLKQAEEFYTQQVSSKLNTIKDQEVKINAEMELKQLDEVYEQLRIELSKSENANLDVIISAMIKNHKTKSEILELILEKQKNQNPKNEKLSI
jgi:hypothetical protein